MSWYAHVDARHALVSPGLLRVAMPNVPGADAWAEALDGALRDAGITELHDIAMFLAQVGHESASLSHLEESLWYSAERLTQVWPGRFPTLADAEPFSGNPEALANSVYSGRLGNTEPGDGWRFIGRGPIQLTGRYNYKRCANATGLPIVEHPERLATDPECGAVSAAWYWSEHVTPGAGIKQATREVNGGLHGLADRRERYERIMNYIEQRM